MCVLQKFYFLWELQAETLYMFPKACACRRCSNYIFILDSTPGGCFTNVSRSLQDILSKFVYCRNFTSYENCKLKLCTCSQRHALSTRTKFQLEILTIYVISGSAYFREIILESSRNVSETTSWLHWAKTIARRDEKHLSLGIWCVLY